MIIEEGVDYQKVERKQYYCTRKSKIHNKLSSGYVIAAVVSVEVNFFLLFIIFNSTVLFNQTSVIINK